MDKLIVERKLDSLMRCLERIRIKTPEDVNELLMIWIYRTCSFLT